MVATPQQIAALVGKVVRVKIGETEEVQGDLHSYDPASNMAALNVPTEPGSSLKHFVIARGEHIHSISAVEGAVRASAEGDDLIQLSVEAVNKREKKALDKAVDDARHINTGVSNQVQNVFNALRKTMPCEWKGNDIVVMGLVTIRGPRYVPESCEGADEGSLSRVRKVVRARPPPRGRGQAASRARAGFACAILSLALTRGSRLPHAFGPSRPPARTACSSTASGGN